MTQRTREMHPFAECPYKTQVEGRPITLENGKKIATFEVSIIDERTGEQVEGYSCTGRKALRDWIGRRMAFWRSEWKRESETADFDDHYTDDDFDEEDLWS